MHKKLFIPGPVEVRQEVLSQMALPLIGHRGKDASQLQENIINNFKKIFYTNEQILLSTSSGSGLMEGAIRSCTLKKAAVFSIGAFGDRWYEMAISNNIVADKFEKQWGEAFTKEEIERFKTGLKIEDYTTAPAKLKVIKYDEQRDSSLLEIKIHEGKNRQVRKMCKAINHPVLRLRRSAMGKIKIGDCEIGKYRYLTEDEIKYLKNL